MEVWDFGLSMCMPFPMANMSMNMLMVHGNGFIAENSETGSRGKSALVGPDMFMVDAGSSVGDRQYWNLDFMGTVERWTFPESGSPLLGQVGEENAQGVPYVDAQHPHSSPLMGLTLSDTIAFGKNKNHVKLYFAPRGESTDGPIAFMHRPSGIMNPDAPLGHHVAQDVGHITSTVIGASLKLNIFRLEASVFHGMEPQPSNVDLPIGTIDSTALRFISEFSQSESAMISAAYIQNPEANSPDIQNEWRYSGSFYSNIEVSPDWTFYNSVIFGLIQNYDHAHSLASVGEEFLLRGDGPNLWARLELLQRTPGELNIPVATSGRDINAGVWISAATLGYTQTLAKYSGVETGIGGSVTADFFPGDFATAYGGGTPWSTKIFLQISGMKMWEL